MFKLIRKYDKWILAIGGSLLMVVFLLPQALQQFGANPRKATAAVLESGEKITEGDLMEARQELSMLQAMSPLITTGMLQLGFNQDGSTTDDISPSMHWILLTREAERDGLIGGAQDGRNFLPVAARFFARQYILQNRFSLDMNQLPDIEAQLTETYIAQLETSRAEVINSGFPPLMVDRTLARARGILRMYEAYLSFDLPALQESMELCHRFFDSAEVCFYTIGSDALIDPTYEPDETEVLLHYGTYKEDLPGEGEYGFGYRAEDRVKLEWLRLNRQEIADGVDVDPIEANTRWRGDRSRYPGEFAAERENIERDIRDEKTATILREAEQLVRAELLKGRGGLAQNRDGSYELPADWNDQRARFNVISQHVGDRLRTKHGPDIPNPTSQDDSTRWRTQADVRGIPIIGNATRLIGPRNVPLVELVFSVSEFNEEPQYPVQTGIAEGPLTASRTGDVVFFRVLEASASAPLPLAEVRDSVVEDIRRMKAYEALQAEAPRMLNDIMNLGADAAATARSVTLYKDVKVQRDQVQAIDPTTGPPAFELRKINTESFRDAVMNRVGTFAVNDPLNRIPEIDLLLSVPLDDVREVAIAGITNVIPLTTEAYRMIEAEALQFNRTREYNVNALDAWPYSTSQMQARYGISVVRPADADEEEAEVDETPVAEAIADDTAE